MSTTTIHLPDDLKERLDRAAQQAGTSAHAFILAAIAEKTDQEDLQADVNREADRRLAQLRELKDVIPWTRRAFTWKQWLLVRQSINRLPRSNHDDMAAVDIVPEVLDDFERI